MRKLIDYLKVKNCKIKLATTILFCIVLIIGCKKEEPEQEKIPPKDTFVLSDNTVNITEQDNKQLLQLEDDLLIFSNNNERINKIKKGDILMSGLSEQTPDGYLRKVTEIIKENGNVIVKTEDASLEEAIKECHISFSHQFTDDDILLVDDYTDDEFGIKSLPKQKSGISFSQKFNFKTAIDKGLTASGSIKIEPTLKFEIIITNNKLHTLNISLSQKTDVSIKFEGKASGGIKKDRVLYFITLGPITIPSTPIPIGRHGIPIILSSKGNVSATISYKAENSYSEEVGLLYEKATGWKPIYNHTTNVKNPETTIGGEASISGGLGISYEARLYGLRSKFSVGMSTGPKLEAKLDAKQTVINWKLLWYLEAKAVAQAKVFSMTLADFERSFFEKEWVIKDGVYRLLPINHYTFDETANSFISKVDVNLTLFDLWEPTSFQLVGVCYSSTNPEPTITSGLAKYQNFNGTSYSIPVSGLNANTQYYVRGFIKTKSGQFIYGDVITCNTLPEDPTVDGLAGTTWSCYAYNFSYGSCFLNGASGYLKFTDDTHAEFYNRNGVNYNLELSGTYTLTGTKLDLDFGHVVFAGTILNNSMQGSGKHIIDGTNANDHHFKWNGTKQTTKSNIVLDKQQIIRTNIE